METAREDYVPGEAPSNDLGEEEIHPPNLTSSTLYESNLHVLTVDVDFPCAVIPSSTPGHFHLMIDKTMTWDQYRTLLQAMADAGILQQGYVDASVARGASMVAMWDWKKR